MKVAAAGLCTCGVVLAVAPSAGAAPTTYLPAHQVKYVPWYPGDSEPPHPDGPEQTLDGPTVEYAGTVPVSHRIDTSSTFALNSGGAIEIDHLSGPVTPKHLRAPRRGGTG